MINIFHLAAIIFGLFAYIFSDVNSSNGFTNLFLPIMVTFCFIYGVIVTLSLIMRKNNSDEHNKSADFLVTNMKELNKEATTSNDKPQEEKQTLK